MTPHAVHRFVLMAGWGLSYEEGRDRLIELCAGAHFVKLNPRTGAEIWRLGRPHRFRLIVRPAATPGDLPAIVTVLTMHEGQGQKRSR